MLPFSTHKKKEKQHQVTLQTSHRPPYRTRLPLQIEDDLLDRWLDRLTEDSYVELPTVQGGPATYTRFAEIQNFIQHNFECCGVAGIMDYSQSTHWPKQDFVSSMIFFCKKKQGCRRMTLYVSVLQQRNYAVRAARMFPSRSPAVHSTMSCCLMLRTPCARTW